MLEMDAQRQPSIGDALDAYKKKQRSLTSRGTDQVFVKGFETTPRQEYMAGVQGRSTCNKLQMS